MISRKQALGQVLSEQLPEMRTAELAAALIADGQEPLFGEFDTQQALARRRRAEALRAPLFEENTDE